MGNRSALRIGSDIWYHRGKLGWNLQTLENKSGVILKKLEALEKMESFTEEDVVSLKKITKALRKEIHIRQQKSLLSELWGDYVKISEVDPWKQPHEFLDIIEKTEFGEIRYCDLLEPWQWAWEFLRRNLNYQETYSALEQSDFNFNESMRQRLEEFGLQSAPDPNISAWSKSINIGIWDTSLVRPLWAYSGQNKSEIPPFYPSNKVPLRVQEESFKLYMETYKKSLPEHKVINSSSIENFPSWLKTYDCYQQISMQNARKKTIDRSKVAAYVFPNNRYDQDKTIDRYRHRANGYINDEKYKSLLFFNDLGSGAT